MLGDHVRFTRVEGVGILYADGRVSFGYAEDARVVAELTEEGYRVVTPLADIAVGAVAERRAARFAEEQIMLLEKRESESCPDTGSSP
ncbi:MAG: hypothetical protein ACYS99_11025 [Planctomycetota bacterium]